MNTFKIGDKVLVKHNSHFPKPLKIVAIVKSKMYLSNAIDFFGNYIELAPNEVWHQEIWSSPLFQALKEEE